MSLNKVMLIGNVGRDPEVRHLANNSIVAKFPLATSEKFKLKSGELQEQTEWHNIVCWRSLAELAENYIKKGSRLYIEGRIKTSSWVDKTT
ncbi:MAG: single-stranded DNA-binding protein, partial [Bacteroidales bacterium]